MELTALALRTHPVIVLIDQPLRNILHKPDLTGRMLQWAIELSEFGIEFQPKLSQVKKSGGPCELMEFHDHQGPESGFCYNPQQGNIWSKPSGWDSLPPTMKQNMRPSYPDWTSLWLYPSPSSGQTENGRADALAGIAVSLPIKETILLPIHMQTNPSVAKTSTCNTIEASQADDQEWTHRVSPDRNSARRSQTGTQDSGASRPLHPDWGALVQAILYRTLPSVPKSFKGPVCPISSPWPFAQWGMDIVGPLPAAPAQKKFLLVATDYFSKWVEAEAYASIKDKDVTKFVWKNIICRFGIPQTIIADNGPQFDSITFRNFCLELNIRNSYSTPRYPQSNEQAEATNKTLITALKKRLEQAKRKWVEELPGVLWAYRTTPGRPTGNTPFALAYSMDAVIPTEIGLPTIRTEAAKQDDANKELGRSLDWADEVRETASIWMTDYQQRASAHYNRKQTRPPALLFALISAAANLLSASFQLKPPATSSSASCKRASINSSRLFTLAKSARRASLSPRTADKLASASSSLRRS
ncbi:hypothetical protein AAG906_013784 [Vitis piasezkii]